MLAAKAVAPMPPPAGNRIGFVTPSGAFAVHLSDLCRERTDLVFPKLRAPTLERIRAVSPPFIVVSSDTVTVVLPAPAGA